MVLMILALIDMVLVASLVVMSSPDTRISSRVSILRMTTKSSAGWVSWTLVP